MIPVTATSIYIFYKKDQLFSAKPSTCFSFRTYRLRDNPRVSIVSLIICVKNYECTQVVINPIKSISVMELVKYETILSLCIESLKPSFNLGDKEELIKERIHLEKAKKNEKQPEKGAEKKRKHPYDSNTELRQHEKSKK